MKNYADKYHMSPEQSVFLAKKKYDENVYCGMRMENRAVTFPQTKTILQGVNVPNVQLSDIQAILNMRDAWQFLLGSMDQPVTLDYLCKINEYIARNEALEWGKLRTGSVMISGTDYLPPVPSAEAVAAELAEILSADTSTTAKALEAFVWGARGQFFWDGNKRTSAEIVVANAYFGDSKRDEGGSYNSSFGGNAYGGNTYSAPAAPSYGSYSAPAAPASDFAMLDDDDAQLPF